MGSWNDPIEEVVEIVKEPAIRSRTDRTIDEKPVVSFFLMASKAFPTFMLKSSSVNSEHKDTYVSKLVHRAVAHEASVANGTSLET